MDFLGHARKMLRGLAPSEPPKPQYYDVACPEGHRLQGQRTEGYQALRCPTCGGGIFVLPKSPLPEPPEPTPKVRSKPVDQPPASDEDSPIALTDPPRQDEDEVVIEWVDPAPAATPTPAPPIEPVAAPPVVPPRVRRAPTIPKPAPAPSPQPEQAAPARPMVRVADRPGLGDWMRRRRHRLVFSAVAIVVVGTAALLYRKQWLQDLPKTAEIGRTRGLDALDAGDFDTANDLLSKAARAVKALGGEYQGSDAILQGADEAAIYADLAPASLETILDEAASYRPREDWPARFKARYQGRAIIVEAHVTAIPGGTRSAYDLDYRIIRPGPGGPRVGRLDLTGFRLFERVNPKEGAWVLFGARLESLALGERGQWLFRLEPESGVTMTHLKALEALGWPPIAVDKVDHP